MSNILILYDFTNSQCLPYHQAKEAVGADDSLVITNCLSFFSFDYGSVRLLKENGDYMNSKEILLNNGDYTNKEIRTSHNLQKLLLSGSLKWQKGE